MVLQAEFIIWPYYCNYYDNDQLTKVPEGPHFLVQIKMLLFLPRMLGVKVLKRHW